MDKHSELTQRDERLLEEIEKIVANGGGEWRETDSLYGFCAQLASTVPQASEGFREHLETRLVARIKRQENRVEYAHTPAPLLGLKTSGERVKQVFRVNEGLAMKKVLILAAIAALVIIVGTMLLVPSVRAQIGDVIKRVILGPYSQAKQIEFEDTGEPQPLPKDMWLIKTDIGAFGGSAGPGKDIAVRTMPSFEEAQAAADFHILTPTYLPEGYVLREIKLAPVDGPPWVFLFYSGPGRDITVVQMSVGPQPSDDPNVVEGTYNSMVTNGTLEEVDPDGRPAAWINGRSLMWEANGVSYTVGGRDLDLEQAKQIARSLR